MIRLPLVLLHLVFLISLCRGQTQPLEIKKKNNSRNQYKDFVYDGNIIWALTIEGKLTLFDATNGDLISRKVKNDSPIIALANDKEGNIIIGDKSKMIKKYDKQTKTWIPLYKFDTTLLAITFDSKNNYYLITNKGVFDVSTKEYFYPDISQNYQIRHNAGWFREPALLTDRSDNIWIGFGYGEWGGELFIFNTTDRKFIVPNLKGFPIALHPIKSIFESNENVFVTSGLMHFFISGSIVKFDNFQSSPLFESESSRISLNDSTNGEITHGEYIGPGTYNHKDSSIYFYSQNGIFRGNPANDLSKIEHWTKVFQPKLHWKNGQSDAVGSPMNVLKIQFVNSDKLIFVSQNDGIGIYDGKALIMTR
ncbi:MAG: hypothetical protein NTW29_16570 [Bacteroidetes bacterium]|nr:hypothetical protein [Bacteroidota bacterium]